MREMTFIVAVTWKWLAWLAIWNISAESRKQPVKKQPGLVSSWLWHGCGSESLHERNGCGAWLCEEKLAKKSTNGNGSINAIVAWRLNAILWKIQSKLAGGSLAKKSWRIRSIWLAGEISKISMRLAEEETKRLWKKACEVWLRHDISRQKAVAVAMKMKAQPGEESNENSWKRKLAEEESGMAKISAALKHIEAPTCRKLAGGKSNVCVTWSVKKAGRLNVCSNGGMCTYESAMSLAIIMASAGSGWLISMQSANESCINEEEERKTSDVWERNTRKKICEEERNSSMSKTLSWKVCEMKKKREKKSASC